MGLLGNKSMDHILLTGPDLQLKLPLIVKSQKTKKKAFRLLECLKLKKGHIQKSLTYKNYRCSLTPFKAVSPCRYTTLFGSKEQSRRN